LKGKILILTILCISYLQTFSQVCEPKNVTNTRTEPYKYVCYLKKFKSNGTAFTSTAFLIAPRVLLTNAHNVYNAASFKIAPAHNGQGTKLTEGDAALTYRMETVKCSSSNTFYNDSFIWRETKRTREQARHYDYAIIILPDSSLYKKLGGFLEITECDLVARVRDSVSFIGYPGGIKDYNLQLFQKTNAGILTGYYENGNMISYELGTHKGASGSPILINQNGKYKVIGIHGYGSGCENSAIKITKEVLAKIKEWTVGL
jgi:glutamyl endopeptidase